VFGEEGLTSMGHLKALLPVMMLHSNPMLEKASHKYAPMAKCDILLKTSAEGV
jgi:hypothetical protein